jgi:two-component system, NtrC family, sensor kinase
MMKKVLLIWLLSVISFANTIAQNNLPPAYEINTDTAVNVTLDKAYWQMLEDPEDKWTIDQVSRLPIADKFHANINNPKGVDYSINTFWLRYRFKNNMRHEARITIPKDVTYADLYTPVSDDNWNLKMTGTSVPWSKRDDLKSITTVTYTIQPGEELLIYERDRFNYLINDPGFLEIHVGFTDKVIQDYYDDNDPSILSSFLFGVFLLAALFNLYFFLIVRGRVYLFFALTLLFRGVSRFLYSNDIFFREHPIVKWDLAHVCSVLFFFFLIHFLRYFLETFKYFPRWDKYLIGLSIYYVILLILVSWNIIPIPFEYRDIIGPTFVAFSILITFILFLRSHWKVVRLAIVAVLPLICIMTIATPMLFRFINKHTGIPIAGLSEWVSDRLTILEQVALLWLLIFFSWSLFQRYQQLQQQITEETLAKERLAKEKEIERTRLIAQQKIQLEKEVTERTSELKQSLHDLKSTQSQLIQQEKMASLGALTAGIAHEIQNPLNFVNNFSEVNRELIDELQEERNKEIRDFKNENELLNDIKENEQKINHHGKRADAIVKGMLQHSQSSSGIKEPTDINKLADEYLRLAYHGFRAKDKAFNAILQTDFDAGIGKINIIPQDIGRVLMNLYNNAFYAVTEKNASTNSAGQQYEPTVSVSTKKLNDKVEISVKDNGNGISQKVMDKIFQPFFTTKPTGQGTGLGLSLSYDILKAQGGEIKVDTTEGEFAEFVIQLPITV